MNIKKTIIGAILGAGIAFGAYRLCQPAPKPRTLECVVQETVTNSSGSAFSGEQDITIVNRAKNRMVGVAVRLYTMHENDLPKGDVYLAGSPAVGGGLAVYAHASNAPGSPHGENDVLHHFLNDDLNVNPSLPGIRLRYAQSLPYNSGQATPSRSFLRRYAHPGNADSSPVSGRELVIRPSAGVTAFDHDSQEVLYDLARWTVDQEVHCDGLLTTEELIAGREQALRLISYVDPAGIAQEVYDNVQWLIDRGILQDLPAGKEWYVLTPTNPTAPPMLIQRDLASREYEAVTVMRLEEVCSGVQRHGNAGMEKRNPEHISPTPAPSSTGDTSQQPAPEPISEGRERCLPELVRQGNFGGVLDYFGLTNSEILSVRRQYYSAPNPPSFYPDMLFVYPRLSQLNPVFNKIGSRLTQEFGSPRRHSSGIVLDWNDQGCNLRLIQQSYDNSLRISGSGARSGIDGYRDRRTPDLQTPFSSIRNGAGSAGECDSIDRVQREFYAYLRTLSHELVSCSPGQVVTRARGNSLGNVVSGNTYHIDLVNAQNRGRLGLDITFSIQETGQRVQCHFSGCENAD
ncbi:hypothetical protein HYU22_03390 [Candidatus Woesearchaeota archaeon]|nr:hypothetical protein [Candidatus Woesearchaeota archaeon]